MRKGLVLLLFGLLVACGPSGNAELEAAVSATSTAVVPPVAAIPTATTNATDASSQPDPDTAVSDYPIATTLAEATQVREIDWTLGAEEPLFTIIEYGDFQ